VDDDDRLLLLWAGLLPGVLAIGGLAQQPLHLGDFNEDTDPG
jgi:hypothetical protein